MIETPRDISKLLSLNVDLGYLLKNPDANTPQRIFDAVGQKMADMNYCLVHKEDLREEQVTTEDAPQPAKTNPVSLLVPIEGEQ